MLLDMLVAVVAKVVDEGGVVEGGVEVVEEVEDQHHRAKYFLQVEKNKQDQQKDRRRVERQFRQVQAEVREI
jgi:hypothetical protein